MGQRFCQPKSVLSNIMVTSPTTHTTGDDVSAYDKLLGSDSFLLKNLPNKEDGGQVAQSLNASKTAQIGSKAEYMACARVA